MSRSYSMSVTITNPIEDRINAIQEAAEEVFPFDCWESLLADDPKDGLRLDGHGDGALYAGMTEEEFAEQLTRAIWKANGGYCHVEVQETCLEELPYETYYFDEEQYEKLTKKQEEEPSDG